jgi:hypothetical protein
VREKWFLSLDANGRDQIWRRGGLTAMSVTINLSSDELAQIKRFTELEDEREAVAKAAREFLRVTQLRELKAASGKVDYQDTAETMEALELRERHPSQ